VYHFLKLFSIIFRKGLVIIKISFTYIRENKLNLDTLTKKKLSGRVNLSFQITCAQYEDRKLTSKLARTFILFLCHFLSFRRTLSLSIMKRVNLC